jgi:hypothetical protein
MAVELAQEKDLNVEDMRFGRQGYRIRKAVALHRDASVHAPDNFKLLR